MGELLSNDDEAAIEALVKKIDAHRWHNRDDDGNVSAAAQLAIDDLEAEIRRIKSGRVRKIGGTLKR